MHLFNLNQNVYNCKDSICAFLNLNLYIVHTCTLWTEGCLVTSSNLQNKSLLYKPVATTFCTLSLNGDKMLFIYVSGQFGHVSCKLCHIRPGMSMVSSPSLCCVGGKSWHLGPQSFIRYSKYFWDFNCLAGSWILF